MDKVACDICGQDYQVLPERRGEYLRCKVCLCEFEVAKFNLVIDEEDREPTVQEWWNSEPIFLTRRIVRGMILLALMALLTSLFFVDPPPRVDFRRGSLPAHEHAETERA